MRCIVAVLSLLEDSGAYRACEWDLTEDADGRAYWLDLFRTHILTITDLIQAEEGAAVTPRLDAFLAEYLDGLEILDTQPDAWGPLNVLKLTLYRQDLLARHGFPDPFAEVKARETAAAIALYPNVVARVDALAPAARLEALAFAVMAGNEFDLGSKETTERYQNDGHDFAEAMCRVSPRPWPEDDLDGWSARLLGGHPVYRRALFFVDNAGADVILGCLPLARELARMGSRVTVAANTLPALNDITIGELDDAFKALRTMDPVLDAAMCDGRIRTVASGCRAPLIDLTDVSDACAEAGRGADLVILEGMGRSVETNRSARFVCDALRIALIKDSWVARHVGVPLFSPAWRFHRV